MKLGAHDYIDTSKEDATEALQKLGGADLVVSTAPDPKLVGPLVGALGPLGKLLILARESPCDVCDILYEADESIAWWQPLARSRLTRSP